MKIILNKQNYNQNELSFNNFNKLNCKSLLGFINKKTNNNFKMPKNIINEKLYLVNIIRTKIYNLKKIKLPENIIYNFILNNYFSYLGNCYLKNLSINDEDLDTLVNIHDIPVVYLFCINDNGEIYSFDIRTLHNIYILNNNEKKNPYTRNIISCDILLQVKRKLNFLDKMGFLIYHIHYLKKIYNKKLDLNEIVYKLYNLDYNINKEWLFDLSIIKLKKLYFELFHIWTNSHISNELKNSIIDLNNGSIFNEYAEIADYKKKDKDKLFNIILYTINRIITEGKSLEYKKIGALYFICSLVSVSKEAKNVYYFLNF